VVHCAMCDQFINLKVIGLLFSFHNFRSGYMIARHAIYFYGTIESVVLSLMVGAFNHTKSHNWIENGHLLKMTASKSKSI
jgi:hypothetical protein